MRGRAHARQLWGNLHERRSSSSNFKDLATRHFSIWFQFQVVFLTTTNPLTMLINVKNQKKEFMRKFHIHALIYNTVCAAPLLMLRPSTAVSQVCFVYILHTHSKSVSRCYTQQTGYSWGIKRTTIRLLFQQFSSPSWFPLIITSAIFCPIQQFSVFYET